jgi:uncharacterized protein with PQ loop repeat
LQHNNNKMYNHIILSASLFGSVYIFSKSLQLLNQTSLEKDKVPLIVINGTTFIISGYILFTGCKLLNLPQFMFSNK